VGSVLTAFLHHAPAGKVSALLIGLPAHPLPVGFGCTIFPDLGNSLLAGIFMPNAAGEAKLSLPIPKQPVFHGVTLTMQTWVAPTATPPWNMDFTNGVFLGFGD
jgi:hypothetical protein